MKSYTLEGKLCRKRDADDQGARIGRLDRASGYRVLSGDVHSLPPFFLRLGVFFGFGAGDDSIRCNSVSI